MLLHLIGLLVRVLYAQVTGTKPLQVQFDKKFQRVVPTKKRITKLPIHPLAVVHDLKNGSMVSLDRYLRTHRGPLDREVAVELRKLISGTKARTLYRLRVVLHPDGPQDKGGARKKSHLSPTDDERAIALAYSQRPQGVQKQVHDWDIAQQFKLKNVRDVKNTADKVFAFDAMIEAMAEKRRLAQLERDRIAGRHQQALEALKSKKTD